VTRAELFTTDATRRAITFHDLCATGSRGRRSRRRPAPHQAARRPPLVLDDRGLHPRGREPAGGLRRTLSAPTGRAGGSFGSGFGISASSDAQESQFSLVRGGATGDRTPDLRIANAALSQLSYCPESCAIPGGCPHLAKEGIAAPSGCGPYAGTVGSQGPRCGLRACGCWERPSSHRRPRLTGSQTAPDGSTEQPRSDRRARLRGHAAYRGRLRSSRKPITRITPTDHAHPHPASRPRP
jgi:hypothetical protein